MASQLARSESKVLSVLGELDGAKHTIAELQQQLREGATAVVVVKAPLLTADFSCSVDFDAEIQVKHSLFFTLSYYTIMQCLACIVGYVHTAL